MQVDKQKLICVSIGSVRYSRMHLTTFVLTSVLVFLPPPSRDDSCTVVGLAPHGICLSLEWPAEVNAQSVRTQQIGIRTRHQAV
jgi:hypothetical protein